MHQYPVMVDEYLQCGKESLYNAVYLLNVLDLKDTNQDVDRDKMTAVIRY